jgi:hypothetical protein
LARAKNTSRAEARKRTRDAQRAEMAEFADDELLDDEVETVEDQPRRQSPFKMPNIVEDLRALPGIFRTKRIVWVPFLLVLIGFVLALVIYGIPESIQPWIALYLQFFFVPQGLFAYFIAGFVAPRASYLVGGLLGLMSGAMYGIALVATLPPGTDPVARAEITSVAMSSPLTGAILGTFAGGFAAWYRGFLRGMQVNGAQRRADREAKERAKRREERQQARSVFKSRSSER